MLQLILGGARSGKSRLAERLAADSQLEVRAYASNTLAGMLRCLAKRFRDPMIATLKSRFFAELEANPMPRRGGGANGSGGGFKDTTTQADAQAQVVRAEATLQSTKLLAERYAELIKTNAVSRQEFDDANARLKSAQADLAAQPHPRRVDDGEGGARAREALARVHQDQRAAVGR